MSIHDRNDSMCEHLLIGEGSLILKTSRGNINDEDVPCTGCSVKVKRKNGEKVYCPKGKLGEGISPFCWRVNQIRKKQEREQK